MIIKHWPYGSVPGSGDINGYISDNLGKIRWNQYSLPIRAATNVGAPYGMLQAGGYLSLGQPFGAGQPYLCLIFWSTLFYSNSGTYIEVDTQNRLGGGGFTAINKQTTTFPANNNNNTLETSLPIIYDGTATVDLALAMTSGTSMTWYAGTFTAVCLHLGSAVDQTV